MRVLTVLMWAIPLVAGCGDGGEKPGDGTGSDTDTDTDTDADTATDTGRDTGDDEPATGAPEGTPVVSIQPESPNQYQDLTCIIESGATDPEGDTVYYWFAWAVDGGDAGTDGPTVSADLTALDQEWTCTVTATDGVHVGESGTGSATIRNTAPGAPAVAVEPSEPSTDDDLLCSIVTDSVDADGDAVTYSYAWIVDGVDAGIAEASVDAASTSEGQEWTCSVTPSDGYEDGPSGSASVTVSLGCFSLWFDPELNSYVQIEADDALSLSGTDFTIELWLNSGEELTTMSRRIVGAFESTNRQILINYAAYAEALTLVLTSGGTKNEINTSFVPIAGVWHHIAVQRGGTSISIYVDGALDTEALHGGTLPVLDADMFIGNRVSTDSSGGWHGQLDNVRFSSVVRYTEDFTPPTTYVLDEYTIASWSFDEGDGTTTVDDSGHGHDGTINGATWIAECSSG